VLILGATIFLGLAVVRRLRKDLHEPPPDMEVLEE
jgi:hypothetical protein